MPLLQVREGDRSDGRWRDLPSAAVCNLLSASITLDSRQQHNSSLSSKRPPFSASPITKYLCKRRCDRKGHTAFCYSYGYLFAFASAVKGDTIVLLGSRQINDADSIVVNFNLLFSVSTALIGSVDYYFVNQIINHLRG